MRPRSARWFAEKTRPSIPNRPGKCSPIRDAAASRGFPTEDLSASPTMRGREAVPGPMFYARATRRTTGTCTCSANPVASCAKGLQHSRDQNCLDSLGQHNYVRFWYIAIVIENSDRKLTFGSEYTRHHNHDNLVHVYLQTVIITWRNIEMMVSLGSEPALQWDGHCGGQGEERGGRRRFGVGIGSANFVEFDLLAGAFVHLRLGQSLGHPHQEQLLKRLGRFGQLDRPLYRERNGVVIKTYRGVFAALELSRVVDAPQETVFGAAIEREIYKKNRSLRYVWKDIDLYRVRIAFGLGWILLQTTLNFPTPYRKRIAYRYRRRRIDRWIT